MLKLIGSCLVLSGGFLLWTMQIAERRLRRQTLVELEAAFRRAYEEIRMTRVPLPQLLEKIAANCSKQTVRLFDEAKRAAQSGEGLERAWEAGVRELTLSDKEKESLLEISFNGDEESICKAFSIVSERLAKSREVLDGVSRSEEQRITALCFSGAALLVILLI